MSAPFEEVTGENQSKMDGFANACFRYIPLSGSASLLCFSTHVMAPKLFQRVCAPYEMTVANCLWASAHLGAGLYIYNTEHVRRSSMMRKMLYSSGGAVIFNFGTLLLWVTAKNALPKCNFVRSIFGVLSGLTMLVIGRDYLLYVDKSVLKRDLDIPEE